MVNITQKDILIISDGRTIAYEFSLCINNAQLKLRDIKSLTLSLVSHPTYQIVNSRDEQNILNMNDVEVDSTGQARWILNEYDNEISDPITVRIARFTANVVQSRQPFSWSVLIPPITAIKNSVEKCCMSLQDVTKLINRIDQLTKRVDISTIPSNIEGYGANTVGGKNGKKYVVTRPDDPTALTVGTLRHAINQNEARLIVFDIDEPINIDPTRAKLNMVGGNITIDGGLFGQTINGGTLSIVASETHLKNLRVRLGLGTNGTGDCITAASEPAAALTNVVIERCSLFWSTDELLGFNSFLGEMSNITIQWCLLAEPLGSEVTTGHGLGALFATSVPPNNHGIRGLTFHHNIIAHALGRGPSIITPGEFDVVNNVFYNFTRLWTRIDPLRGAIKANVLNNYYLPGSNTVSEKCITLDEEQPFSSQSEVVVLGNYQPTLSPNMSLQTQADLLLHLSLAGNGSSERNVTVLQEVIAGTPLPTMQNAITSRDMVLQFAGCPNRDAHDLRVTNHIKTRTGVIVDTPPVI